MYVCTYKFRRIYIAVHRPFLLPYRLHRRKPGVEEIAEVLPQILCRHEKVRPGMAWRPAGGWRTKGQPANQMIETILNRDESTVMAIYQL